MGKRKAFDTRVSDTAAGLAAPGASTLLREARIRHGRDLPEVASILRIRLVYLQAIEDGRYADLPGTAYAAGFLRSYAEYLGLDADLIVRRFKEEAAGQAAKQELYFPTPVPEGRVPGGTILLGTLVLAGIVYGGWYYATATDRSMVDLVPALPDRLVSLLDTLPWSSTTRPPDEEEAPGAAAAPPVAPAAVAPPATVPPAAVGEPPTGAATAAAPSPAPVPSPAPAVTSAPPPAAPVVAQATPATTPPPAVAAAPAPAPAPAPLQTPAPATAAAAAPPPAPPMPAVTPPPTATATGTVPPPPPAAVAAPDEEPEMTTQEPTPLSATATALPSMQPPPAAPPPVAQPGAVVADAAVPAGRVYGTQNQNSRIQLRATQDSWIQVRDANNELLFTRVLRPGDVYRVPDRPGIRVRTGNAGGLIVVTDGVEGPPMGAVGQVLRDVPLDSPALRSTSG